MGPPVAELDRRPRQRFRRKPRDRAGVQRLRLRIAVEAGNRTIERRDDEHRPRQQVAIGERQDPGSSPDGRS